MPNEILSVDRSDAEIAKDRRSVVGLRPPTPADGAKVWDLIAACPPLDPNSLYANLLQCSHFADTCVVAEGDGRLIGWVSGYRPPSAPEVLFVWQVAVNAEARGQGLALRMIKHLLERPTSAGARYVHTTITPDNAASWALFEKLAQRLATRLESEPWFEKDRHFAGRHETERLVRIGPFEARR